MGNLCSQHSQLTNMIIIIENVNRSRTTTVLLIFFAALVHSVWAVPKTCEFYII